MQYLLHSLMIGVKIDIDYGRCELEISALTHTFYAIFIELLFVDEGSIS